MPSEITREKQLRRLARLRPNTGHAKVLRAKLGISGALLPDPAPIPAPIPAPKAPKKKTSKKKKT